MMQQSSFTSELSLWGNSLGLRIPKQICDALDLEKNSKITLKISNDQLVVKKAEDSDLDALKALASKTKLKDLTKKISKKNLHNPKDFSTKTTGKEVW
jgi:antitoxin component of MazEF toxin-antitoxin module